MMHDRILRLDSGRIPEHTGNSGLWEYHEHIKVTGHFVYNRGSVYEAP